MQDDVLLDHLERSFADSYRKEIDQEENVWRSLPFFAATLALQLAALAQIRDWAAGISGAMFIAATILLALAGAATLAALTCLAMSVWPADFRRVAREPELLRYAERLRAELAAAPGATPAGTAAAALAAVKRTLVEQYATAADSNRRVTEKRGRFRTLAGLATLASVLAMLVLVGLVVLSNMHGHGPP